MLQLIFKDEYNGGQYHYEAVAYWHSVNQNNYPVDHGVLSFTEQDLIDIADHCCYGWNYSKHSWQEAWDLFGAMLSEKQKTEICAKGYVWSACYAQLYDLEILNPGGNVLYW